MTRLTDATCPIPVLSNNVFCQCRSSLRSLLPRLCLLTLLGLLQAQPAAAQSGAAKPHTAAAQGVSVLSLIGDRLEIVSRELGTGTRISRNQRTPLPLESPVFDEAVARTAARVFHQSAPGTPVSQLNTRSAVLFERQRELFEVKGGVLSMPQPILDAAMGQSANRLLLVRKHRAEPRFRFVSGTVDGGNEAIEGLGFYLDGTQMITSFDKEHQRTASGRGFIAPYVHAEVLLVELPSGKVLGRKTVAANIMAGSGRTEGSINEPWLAMTSAEKVRWLGQLIDKDVGEAIAALAESR